ncbi:MAG: hypothetical protein HY761_09920 [Candidatus Omnitrophica bacterium]|nr:hypothetical protein [Candidatus Omnitrophota bacterium]
MFEHKVAEKATQDTQLSDFVDLYSRFTQDALKVSEIINQNRATKQDRFRMRQFEAKIDAEWRKIPEVKRSMLVELLLVKKLLPEAVKRAIQVFEGKVVKVV